MNDANPNDFPVLDEDTIGELRDIMEQEFDDLVETFLEDMPQQLTKITSAVNDKDSDALRKIAHTLKSSSGSIGAPRLSELARRLELLGHQDAVDGASPILEQTRITADKTTTAFQGLLGSRKAAGTNLF